MPDSGALMRIWDWDDTLQCNLNPGSSVGMFLKTIFYPCGDNQFIKDIIDSDDCMIITTRARLYTWAIKIKCFLISWNLKAFQDSKVTTINPNFFYDKEYAKRLHSDKRMHMKKIANMKINLAKIYCEFLKRNDKKFKYIDYDMLYWNSEIEETLGE